MQCRCGRLVNSHGMTCCGMCWRGYSGHSRYCAKRNPPREDEMHIVIWIEVPVVLAASEEALAILTRQAQGTADDIGLKVGMPTVTEGTTPETKVIVWSAK